MGYHHLLHYSVTEPLLSRKGGNRFSDEKQKRESILDLYMVSFISFDHFSRALASS